MNEVALKLAELPPTPPDLTWREKLAYLTVLFLEHPQQELPLEHTILEDTYYRTMTIPKGTLMIGRMHLKGHLCKLLRGDLMLIHENERLVKTAGDEMHTAPGYMTCLYAMTDCIGQTVHPCNGETNIQKLEDAYFETEQQLIEAGRAIQQRRIES